MLAAELPFCREHKGVMIRLECGPRDAAKQQCVLAVSKQAGQVAVKTTYDVSPNIDTWLIKYFSFAKLLTKELIACMRRPMLLHPDFLTSMMCLACAACRLVQVS